MRAMAHHRAYVAHVDLPNGQIAFPPHHVHGIERIKDLRDFVIHFDANLPFAVVVEARRWLGRDDDGRIVQRMLAQQAFLRLVEFGTGLHDQEEIIGGIRQNAVSDGARHDDVIAALERQRAEIGFHGSRAAMYEDQLIAIRVAIVERHGRGAARNIQLYIAIAQERHGLPCGSAKIRGCEPVQVEAMRAELAFEAHPSRGGVGVI